MFQGYLIKIHLPHQSEMLPLAFRFIDRLEPISECFISDLFIIISDAILVNFICMLYNIL